MITSLTRYLSSTPPSHTIIILATENPKTYQVRPFIKAGLMPKNQTQQTKTHKTE